MALARPVGRRVGCRRPLRQCGLCRQVYDKCARPATSRSPTSSDSRARRPASSAPAALLPSEAELSSDVRRQPGDGPPGARGAPRRGPGRLPPGVRLVRRRRPGAPVARSPGHDREPAGRRGRALRAAHPRLPLRGRARTRARRCSTPTRCCGCGGSTSPTASRSRSSRCGAPSATAPSCRGPTSSGRRSTSCSTSSSAARCRRSARPRPRRATPSCWPCRSARRCCAASG